MTALAFHHQTVLLDATVAALLPRDGGRYVDGTLGGGGHAALLLAASGPNGRVLAIDQDPQALANASHLQQASAGRLLLVKSNFREIRRVCQEQEFIPVDGVVFDLGVSSPQFDQADRGFSYRFDARLDMRMDPERSLTAAVIVNEWSEEQLTRALFQYGEERYSRRIARAIIKARVNKPIETTGELVDIVTGAIPAAARRTGPHPARRTFQALRIEVNDELGALAEGLEGAFATLRIGGRMAVITFHSLEDRIVKQTYQSYAQGCICPPDFPVCRCHRLPQAQIVTRKPLVADEAEVTANPRARSAKLRVLQKLRNSPYESDVEQT
ncbi:16S rRNA (cytosine(1402)-N(4))-methyltransferase RsmH [Alicyclobacillus sp. ALC3]|uniref:16S rRNA (cytosine(1402)-N(4))-methyltransferase RsmH n=1 Tax=Alicyclobacillus sp. ALC3 TaxID=2796143 RepID=UPI002379707E|nr:16S rRNA (cytosine(1402)-N(4))-methyltransferase RsmH [Alicyclobacillus sp. ALC3]WDL97452.1 16S rRNA (cytosine(1402)-N(4))-methyltransferase RsmH [Alicyclobacillus sp. ALC3]